VKSTGFTADDSSAGYLYAHDFEGSVVVQQYFPDGVDPRILFRPGENGDESELGERLAEIDRRLGREGRS
jgi:replication-associated recombination protein RarA